MTRQREPVIRDYYVNTCIGTTRKWCLSQSRASELNGNAANLNLGTTIVVYFGNNEKIRTLF